MIDRRKLLGKWCDMRERTTVKGLINHPSYAGCVLDERFTEFSNFFEWAVKQVGCGRPGWQLDKDILIKRNKVYGPDTCVFVPKIINSLILSQRRRRGVLPIGVSICSKTKRLVARCRIETKKITLGWFDDPGEAFAAYKRAKEAEIKRIANEWRAEIDPRTYAALMAYQVEITD